MTVDWKKITRNNKCTVCGSTRSYTNPFARCFECKKRFCFDHIHCGQVNKEMSENDRIRDVCAVCQQNHGYHTL